MSNGKAYYLPPQQWSFLFYTTLNLDCFLPVHTTDAILIFGLPESLLIVVQRVYSSTLWMRNTFDIPDFYSK